jgi:CRP/FNR family transcriptional regulator, nitrogen oxide reductase regulator
MNSLSAFLTKVEPFTRLPVEEVERLSLLCQVVRHAKGEVLYNEGETAAHVWILQEGRLEILKYNNDGRSLAIESIQPKQLFGTLCRLGALKASIYPCTAIAAADSVSVRIPDRFFNGLYNRFPAMVSSTCQLCSLRLGSMQQRAVTYKEPVRTRIVRILFQLQKTNGNELPYTKREISELAATTVETTIRVLSTLQKKHWVASQRGKILLKDIPHLESLLQENMRSGGSYADA